MAAPLCCPDTYVYVYSDGTYIDPNSGATVSPVNFVGIGYSNSLPCYHVQANTIYGFPPLAAIACTTCCPINYGLVNIDGYISGIAGNTIFAGKTYAGKCLSYRDFQTTTPPGVCPCCPTGYIYNVGGNFCTSISKGGQDSTSPIPCIVCDCPAPLPPPVCDSCSNPSLPISFTEDTTTKGCIECGEDDSPRPSDSSQINAFIAGELIDPVIIFKLK